MNSRDRRVPTRRAALALCAVLALCGCAVGPDFVAPPPPRQLGYTAQPVVPAAPGASEPRQRIVAGAVPAEWWQRFGSSTLDRAVAQALAHSPAVAQARATLQQAQALLRAAAGARQPQLDVDAAASRSGGAGAVTDALYSAGPLVQFDADAFRGVRRQIEQQSALRDVQRAQLDAARLSLAGNVVARAIDSAAARAQLDAVQRLLDIDADDVALVRFALQAGTASRADLVAAQAQLAADRALLPPLRQQLALARDALGLLLGRSAADPALPEFDLAQLRLPRRLPLTVPSQLVRRRPDIVAAQAQLHAASAAIGVASADLYPQLSLSASWTAQAGAARLLFAQAGAWQLAAAAAAPLWHGGTLRARRDAAQAAYRAQRAAYRQTVLGAFAQVADVLQALDHDAALLGAQRQARDLAAESLRLQRQAYAAGGAGVLQVLAAQRAYQQAVLGELGARAQRYRDTAQWFTAMGGGAG